MRVSTICGFFLVLAALCAADSVCIECEEFIGKPPAQFTDPQVDEINYKLEVFILYEDLEQTPSRIPITNTPLIIELSNSSGIMNGKNVLYKIYTDDTGKATFNFSQWKKGSIDFRILYCPFCIPGSSEDDCGFMECMKYANMETEELSYGNFNDEIENADDIPDGPGVTPPAEINEEKYLPALEPASYVPPPKLETATPALCLPLGIIFSLLAGSLYMTGRNPFAGFNMGGARMGRHIRYQARGRGYSQSLMAVVQAAKTISAAVSAVQDGVKDEKGNLVKGLDGLKLAEKKAAGKRIFMVSDLKNIGSRVKLISDAVKMAPDIKSPKKGKPLSDLDKFNAAMDALTDRDSGGPSTQIGPDGKPITRGGGPAGARPTEMLPDEGTPLTKALLLAPSILLFALDNSMMGQTFGFSLTSVFVDADKRKINDLAVFKAGAESKAELPSGTEMEVIDQKFAAGEKGEEPNTVVTVLSTEGTDIEGAKQIALITTAEEGTYDFPQGKAGDHTCKEVRALVEIPGGKGEPSTYMTVRELPDGKLEQVGPTTVEIPGGKGEPSTYMTTQQLPDGTTQPVTTDQPMVNTDISPSDTRIIEPSDPNYTAASAPIEQVRALTGAEDGFRVGSDASGVVQAALENRNMVSSLAATAVKSAEAVNTQKIEDANKAMNKDTAYRAQLGGQASASALEPLGKEANAARVSAQGGKPTTQPEAVKIIGAVHNEHFGQESFGGTDAADYVAGEATGLSTQDRGYLAEATSRAMQSSAMSYDNLENITHEEFKQEVHKELVGMNVDPTIAERISGNITSSAVQEINTHARDFDKDLRSGGLNDRFVDHLGTAGAGDVNRVAQTGQMISNKHHIGLLKQNPDMLKKAPEDVRVAVSEHIAAEKGFESVTRARNALESGRPASYQSHMNEAVQHTADYIDVRITNELLKEDAKTKKKGKPGEMLFTNKEAEKLRKARDELTRSKSIHSLANELQSIGSDYASEVYGQARRVETKARESYLSLRDDPTIAKRLKKQGKTMS